MNFSLTVALLALFSPRQAYAAVASFEWACYTETTFQDLRSTFEDCVSFGVDPGSLTVDQLDEFKFQAEMGRPSTALDGFMDWTTDWLSVYQDCVTFNPAVTNPADNFIDMLIVNILIDFDPTVCSIEEQLMLDPSGELQFPNGLLPFPVDILEWFRRLDSD